MTDQPPSKKAKNHEETSLDAEPGLMESGHLHNVDESEVIDNATAIIGEEIGENMLNEVGDPVDIGAGQMSSGQLESQSNEHKPNDEELHPNQTEDDSHSVIASSSLSPSSGLKSHAFPIPAIHASSLEAQVAESLANRLEPQPQSQSQSQSLLQSQPQQSQQAQGVSQAYAHSIPSAPALPPNQLIAQSQQQQQQQPQHMMATSSPAPNAGGMIGGSMGHGHIGGHHPMSPVHMPMNLAQPPNVANASGMVSNMAGAEGNVFGYMPFPTRAGFPFAEVRVTDQPRYGVVIYKQNMTPAFAIHVILRGGASSGFVPFAVQAELFDENDQPINNQSIMRGGFAPCSNEVVSLKIHQAQPGSDELEYSALFERFRINLSGRGKHNFVRFYALSRLSGITGGRECIGVSDRVRIIVSSQANHQRDFICKRVWENMAVSSNTLSALPQLMSQSISSIKSGLPISDVIRQLQDSWRQTCGRAPSENEILYLYRHSCQSYPAGRRDSDSLLASSDEVVGFSIFRDGLWRILYEAEKAIRHDTRLSESWQKGFIHGFFSRSEAEKQVAVRPPGTFAIRFSETDPGVLLIAAIGVGSNIRHCRIPREQIDRGHLFEIIHEQRDWVYLLTASGSVIETAAAFGAYFPKDTLTVRKEEYYENLVLK